MKRKADFDLTREDVEGDRYASDQPENKSQATFLPSNAPEIAQRRILKIKIPEGMMKHDPPQQQKIGSFQLVGRLSDPNKGNAENKENTQNSEQKNIDIPAPSANDNENKQPEKIHQGTESPPNTPEDEKIKEQVNQPEVKPEAGSAKSSKKKVIINRKKDPIIQPGPQFITQEPKKFNINPPVNTNQNPSSGTNLFEKNSLNLFSSAQQGLFLKTQPPVIETKPTTNLFNSNKLASFFLDKDQKKEEKPSNPNGPQNNEEKPKYSLFPNATPSTKNTGSSSLFNQNIQSLFKPVSSVNNGEEGKDSDPEDGDEEGDDDPLEASGEVEIKEETYKDPLYERISFFKVLKFKGGIKLLNEGEISLQKSKGSDTYFIVYRNKTKLVLYQGQLINNISSVSFVSDKKESLSIVAFSKSIEKDKKFLVENPQSSVSRDTVKVQFSNQEDCIKFKESIEQVVSCKK